MLQGLIKNELKMSKTINRYLDMCLKCNACTNFCPSGIDVVDIVALAKAEYFKLHKAEKLKSKVLKFLLNCIKITHIFKPKSKSFTSKVIYFGGCSGVNKSAVKILNSLNIEVITPDFDCCGFPFFVRGDMDNFKEYADKFYSILEKYENYDVVVNCATCEKSLKSYTKWFEGKDVNIKNIFEYIREKKQTFELKKHQKITYHKPCNLNNFEDIKYVLENTKNLEYIEMKDYDKCCGLEGIANFKEHKIMSKLFKDKAENIKSTGAKTVLTSCLACKITLSLYSWGRYKVQDFIEFLAKNIK